MILNGTAIADHSRKHVLLSTIVAILAMAAMLLGVLARHSMNVGRGISGILSGCIDTCRCAQQREYISNWWPEFRLRERI
ncbi:hypothetical protein E3T46_11070 [Cryobacterium sp. Hh11]|uniref:hypothetical protein n=1 Tax=Cryobacterium sp. Hh11 TaxID=2555868 RepID=UPI00106CC366|nr:hypothetical protein [Cryobacterium sp. Hh11]TFD50430.1 hypothetical protein E3T46_11070 [Cryobacterium sp. Hh11]